MAEELARVMDARGIVTHLEQIYSGPGTGPCLADDDVADDVMCRLASLPHGQVPSRLAEPASRKIVFVAGGDTICKVLPCYRPYQALRALGKTHENIVDEHVTQKKDLWLIVFHGETAAGEASQPAGSSGRIDPAEAIPIADKHGSASPGRSAPMASAATGQCNTTGTSATCASLPACVSRPLCAPATWDGVVSVCRVFYPGTADDILRHLGELAQRSVGDYEKSTGVSFMEVKNSPDKFMGYDRYLELPKPRSAWQTRLFLYCQLRLFELFSGDGFTAVGSSNEQLQFATPLREYLCQNILLEPLLQAGAAAVLKLDVVVPDLAC